MNIVVTGASRGIGYHLALALAAGAGNCVIALSRNSAGLARLKDESLSLPGSIEVHELNLETCAAADIAAILAGYSQVDILVNNAGQLLNRNFASLSLADWRSLFEVNVLGTVKMIQAALPFMGKNDLAHIVNIGSMGGLQGTSKFPGLAAYSASKAAVANLTECLAEELKDSNVRVNCLALGAVNTEMLNDAFPGYKAPLDAHEVAPFIARFSLTAHHFMNGKILPLSLSTP
jgi:NAD(P)-dependent dehydrogenase (short-subunit alcohol dehydrogenase family)